MSQQTKKVKRIRKVGYAYEKPYSMKKPKGCPVPVIWCDKCTKKDCTYGRIN